MRPISPMRPLSPLLPAAIWLLSVSLLLPTSLLADDRGTFQTIGMVTDVEPFLRTLAAELAGGDD